MLYVHFMSPADTYIGIADEMVSVMINAGVNHGSAEQNADECIAELMHFANAITKDMQTIVRKPSTCVYAINT